MKFYDIEPGAKIYTACSDGSTYMICDHLDGMYAYCETEKGGGVYLPVTTLLVKEGVIALFPAACPVRQSESMSPCEPGVWSS